jgi:hypothetical protein
MIFVPVEISSAKSIIEMFLAVVLCFCIGLFERRDGQAFDIESVPEPGLIFFENSREPSNCALYNVKKYDRNDGIIDKVKSRERVIPPF